MLCNLKFSEKGDVYEHPNKKKMSPEALITILILAIPIYFLCKWTLNKWEIGNPKSRKLTAIIPTIILSPLAYVGMIVIWMMSVSYYPTKKFNKAEWDTNIEGRYTMSKNIIKSEMLIGKTKEEVIEILGEEFSIYDEEHIAYYLGFVPSMLGIDPDVLDIYFENGKVIKVSQHET